MKYFHLTTRHDGPEDVSDGFLASRASERFCEACHSLLDSSRAVDIEIDTKLDNVPLNFSRPTKVGLIRYDLLELLTEFSFLNYFSIGNVIQADDEPSESISTYVSEFRIYILGGPDSPERYCEVCGERFYHPLGTRYIPKSEVDGRPFYASQFAGIIMDDAVAEAVRSGPWKRKISLTQLKVK